MLFLGAGASTVDPYNYPVSNKFFNDPLSPYGFSSYDWEKLAEALYDDSDAPLVGKDLEEIMFALSELEDFHESRLGKALSAMQYGLARNIEWACEEAHKMANGLRHNVTMVYRGAREKGRGRWHGSLFASLLDYLKEYNLCQCLTVFTTNYDKIVETCCENGKLYADEGDSIKPRRIEFRESFNKNRWCKMELPVAKVNHSVIQLYKLHGSLDWYQDSHDGKIYRVSDETILEKTGRQILIFPGFKGVPVSSHFVHPHNMLEKALRVAKICLAIGFSFRDKYINSIFSDAMYCNSDLHLVILNPKKRFSRKKNVSLLIEEHGEEKVRHLPYRFGLDSQEPVQEVITNIFDKGPSFRSART